MPIWGSRYGLWPVCYVAVLALSAYRLKRDDRLLHWASAAGRGYLEQPLPGDMAVPAMDAGLALGLLAELYELTGERHWLAGGLRLAGSVLDAYCDQPIPRGAVGIDWYESQMGPSFLLHGLSRMALLAGDRGECPLSADHTAR